MFQFKDVLFFACLLCQAFGNEPVFSVVGPKFLRSNEPYKFSVSSSKLERTLSFDFKISGLSLSNKYFEANLKDKKVKSGDLVEFVIDTRKFEYGKYQLKVNAYDPCRKVNYTDIQQLTFNNCGFMLLIQTDKAIYRGGDTVRFRVFSVDSETRAYSNASANLTLYNSDSIAMNVFPNVKFVNGKYEGSFNLSDVATLGQWKLAVETSPKEKYDSVQRVEKNFEVKNYVIPLVDVGIEVPSKVAFSDKSFAMSANAKYKNGQPALGKVKVAFYVLTMNHNHYSYATEYKLRYQKTFDISDAITFEVLLEEHLKVSESESVRIDAEFIEDATQKVYVESVYTDIVPYKYHINVDAKSYFIQGKPYEFTVYVKDFNNKPAPAGLSLRWGVSSYNYATEQYISDSFAFTLGSGGSTKFSIDTSKFSNYVVLRINSSSAGASDYYKFVNLKQKYPLDVKVLTESPEIYLPVDIEVTSSSNVSTGFYHMMSKGLLVAAKGFNFIGGKAVIRFTPDFSYAPQTNIIFHYYDETGKAITKSTVIYVNTKTANYLNLELVNVNVKPRDNATLKISSSLGSVVSLLAIDQNVVNLKSGNDIDKANVLAFTGLNWPSPYNQEWDLIDGEDLFELNDFLLIKHKLSYLVAPIHPLTTTTTVMPVYSTAFYWPEDLEISEEVRFSEIPSSEAPSAKSPSSEAIMSEQPTTNVPTMPTPPRIRQDFFETLLWEDVVVKNPLRVNNKPDKVKGLENHNFTAPDSITSYVISGVSMSDKFGLGLPDAKPILKIAMPFFIEMDLPYSIKRSEVLVQDIYIFNNLGQNQDVIVTVERNDIKFNIVESAFNNWTVSANSFSQHIVSTFNHPVKIVLAIKPLHNGFIDIRIKAIGNLAGDAISKPLRVVANGIKRTHTESVLITIPENQTTIFSHDLKCTIPSSAYEEDIIVTAKVVGDLMGSVLENLDSLIQMPSGCGEQNMIYLVPDILILMYLDSTNQLTPSIRSKLISYSGIGYARELTYKHNDGSFSAFGTSDNYGGSTWLTSYVAKSFMQARKYLYIDPQVISNALIFVTNKQSNSDGSFREDGRIIHTDMQGGTSGTVAMAAYISITLSEALADYPSYQNNRNRALTYVVNNLDHNNVFALAISCYALYLANHSSFNIIYHQFLGKATENDDIMHWNNNIETTAYGLLLMQHLDVYKAMKISKYLISKRNALGGYTNSQDTVVTLQALASFAVSSRANAGTLNLILTPNVGSQINAVVNPQNLLTLQQFDLNLSVRNLNVHTKLPSSGSAVVGLSCEYYEIINDPSPRFNIFVDTSASCIGIMKSTICLNYITNGDDKTANMPLVQMQLPSGYVYDSDTVLPKSILKFEVQNGRTKINLYLQSVSSSQICFNINATQKTVVRDIKAAPVEVFDYYQPTKRAQAKYIISASLNKCGKIISPPPSSHEPSSPEPSSNVPS